MTVPDTIDRAGSDRAIASAVQALRQTLLDAGYRHANAVGELVSRDDTTWVATTYTMGEYSVYAWRRPSGHGELGEVRYVVRITASTDLTNVDALARRLRMWANRPRKGAAWPPKGLGPLA